MVGMYIYGFYRFAWRLKGRGRRVAQKEISNSFKSLLHVCALVLEVESGAMKRAAHPHLIVSFDFKKTKKILYKKILMPIQNQLSIHQKPYIGLYREVSAKKCNSQLQS